MPKLLRAADIAITRCGAITLSELGYAEVCGILIPSPNVSGNHQFKNGEYIAKNGGGIMIQEHLLDQKNLENWIDELLRDNEKRRAYAKKITELCPSDTKEKFLNFFEEIIFK